MSEALVRYFAAARATAGTNEEHVKANRQLGDILAELGHRHGPDFQQVAARCSYLVDSHRFDAQDLVPAGATVDVLPPFAGG
ncbi:MAG: MoaD/ThiS family protein [Propionibacteriaceae bacterium]|jgi:molybdopterin converting factor small subunit|nr:MoaD/ThiS family protein [Propionibacteriaceae bacterium]